MKMKKLFALLLAVCMLASMAACAPAEENKGGNTVTYVDPFAGIEDYDELSAAVYDLVLGDFEKAYEAALAEKNESKRYALMAIAEAKLLGAGIFLPTTSQGGNFALPRVAPYTNTPILWGNDTYRFHDRVVVTELIKAEHIAEMKAKWNEMVGSGTTGYEAWVKQYLADKGYTIKNTHEAYFDADPQNWDVLATAQAADSEILVNLYDGLVEYDLENNIQPALAESWTVSDDGLTYTFKIRQGQIWVDNQGRKVADLKADDFVAGMQHMLDEGSDLNYLVMQGCANIVNTDEYSDGEVTFDQVGVKAVDDYTLQYTLTEPTSYFMTMLGYGVFAPMSRSYYESMGGKFGDDYDNAADSYKYGKGPDSIAYCGPFRITNFTSNNTIKFEANESYWNKDGNNLKEMTFLYTDGSDQKKMYDDVINGVVDGTGLTEERVEMARTAGIFDDYAYVADTDATTYCGFFNLRRAAFANANDASVGISPKTEEEKTRTGAAMLNQHFRLALAMSIDRANYNAQSVGDELKLTSLVNSYVPGNYVKLSEEVTVSINGTDKTYTVGTFYGQIIQDQLAADGIALKVWDSEKSTSAGFDGWYNPDACADELAKAVEELKAKGVEITAEKPIYLDIPFRSDAETSKKQKNAMKQSIEDATDGLIKVNLIEYTTRDNYLYATYWYNAGSEANFDLNDGSGWGPDYGDPSTYLGTMLPNYLGYMTKSLGIF